MEQTRKTLKAVNVKLEGEVSLPGGSKVSQAAATAAAATTTEPGAVVIENTPEYAIIEVTCGCGNKTTIKCSYTQNG